MQDQVGHECLLQGRRESLDELGRQASNEADGVGDKIPLAVVVEAARRRIERLEEPVLHRDVGSRQRVEQRRLAHVRVPGESDRWHLHMLVNNNNIFVKRYTMLTNFLQCIQ